TGHAGPDRDTHAAAHLADPDAGADPDSAAVGEPAAEPRPEQPVRGARPAVADAVLAATPPAAG
ncbi:MAG: hypothetical protein JWN55_2632, partial [Frankiales bacterium]|nr:hypothetical protein [Frankiales bacterium]